MVGKCDIIDHVQALGCAEVIPVTFEDKDAVFSMGTPDNPEVVGNHPAEPTVTHQRLLNRLYSIRSTRVHHPPDRL